MSGTYVFEKPLGMRDFLPNDEQTYHNLREMIAKEMKHWGYQFLSTPTLEYYETVGKASAIDEDRLFKLMDAEGRTVVMRPDMTVPIARVAASGLKNTPLPLRLAYMSPVFRKQEFEAGRPAEFEQIGVELIGAPSFDADAEVIALMVHLFKSVGLTAFKVTVGHVGVVNALLEECTSDPELVHALRALLYEKNDVGFRETVEQSSLSSDAKMRLLTFIETRHLEFDQALATLPKLFPGEKGQVFEQRVKALFAILEAYGVAEAIDLDLTLVSHSDYYTGIVFEGYAGQTGFPIGNGGRYDDLLTKFKRPAPATGFGLHLHLLAEALGSKASRASQSCVLYASEQRTDALREALKMREAGQQVVLQDVESVPDIIAFLKQFDQVIDFRTKVLK